MRKLVLAGLTVTALFAFAAVAMAQYAVPVLTTSGKITPSNAGTKKKPKNGLLNVVFNVNGDSNSTLSRIEYTVPSNVRLDGTGFKTCSVEFIAAQGDSKCPKASLVGTGAATALLGPTKSKLDFNVKVYVSGKKALTLYLVTNLFTIPIPATISGQTVAFDIPERVQSPVTGLYSYVTSVTANLGKQPGIKGSVTKGKGKKRKTRNFVSVRGCTGGVHTGGIKAFLANNPNPPSTPFLQGPFSSPCKK